MNKRNFTKAHYLKRLGERVQSADQNETSSIGYR